MSQNVQVSEFLPSLVSPQHLDVYYSYFLVLLQDLSVILSRDELVSSKSYTVSLCGFTQTIPVPSIVNRGKLEPSKNILFCNKNIVLSNKNVSRRNLNAVFSNKNVSICNLNVVLCNNNVAFSNRNVSICNLNASLSKRSRLGLGEMHNAITSDGKGFGLVWVVNMMDFVLIVTFLC